MNAALREQLESRIKEMATLPALPTVLLPLMQALEMPAADVDVARVVELVSYDESIVAQCVRMANSAMFGRRRAVESVHDAVVALGLWRLSDIVFSCTVPQVFSSTEGAVDPAVFWRHSLCCALVSQKLAGMVRSHSAEKAYLAGLLHDMGILINSISSPRNSRRPWKRRQRQMFPSMKQNARRWVSRMRKAAVCWLNCGTSLPISPPSWSFTTT